MTSTITKLLVAAAAVSALSVAACSKPAENVTSNVTETTNVVEAAPADLNAAPADANATAPADANATNTVAP
jgi:hypothetical protein